MKTSIQPQLWFTQCHRFSQKIIVIQSHGQEVYHLPTSRELVNGIQNNLIMLNLKLMKTILLFLLMIIITDQSKAQKVCNYEFDSLKVKTKIKVQYKQPVMIVIRNINKKLYKIEDSKTET